jgi:hypothetical protein
MTISNYELVKLAQQNHVKLKLPDIKMIADFPILKPKKFMNVIVNIGLDVSEEGHFVCFVVRNGNAFYFDSFGKMPPESVIQYCVQNHLKLGMNTISIQHSSSSNCGVYCFALLKYIAEKSDLYEECNNFINVFDQVKLAKNDDILHRLLLKLGVKHEYR